MPATILAPGDPGEPGPPGWAPSRPRPEPEVEEAATRRLTEAVLAAARGQPLERAVVALARALGITVAHTVLESGPPRPAGLAGDPGGEPADAVDPLAETALEAARGIAARLVAEARPPAAPELPGAGARGRRP